VDGANDDRIVGLLLSVLEGNVEGVIDGTTLG